jgi:hypothetical protein
MQKSCATRKVRAWPRFALDLAPRFPSESSWIFSGPLHAGMSLQAGRFLAWQFGGTGLRLCSGEHTCLTT